MKKFFDNYGFLFLVAGIIIILDQLTKYLVRANLPMGLVWHPEWWLSLYVRIVHWKNTGAAFGIFQSMNNVFMVLSFVVAGVIIYYFPQIPKRDWMVRLAMALLFSGAVGNLIDRLHQGHVTDFISVWNFPVFNVADASISTGVGVLFLAMLWQERQKKVASTTVPPPDVAHIQEAGIEARPEEGPGE